MAGNKDLTKDDVIKATLAKYKRMFKNMPADKRFLAEQIYPNAAYLKGIAHELMTEVDSCGCIAEQVNGNGFTRVDTTSAYKELKDTIRTLNSCIDTLGKLCPELKKDMKTESDALMDFIGAGKK